MIGLLIVLVRPPFRLTFRLRFQAPARVGVLIGEIRTALDEVLARKIADPDLAIAGNEIVVAISRLVEADGLL